MPWQEAADHQGLVHSHRADCSTEPMLSHQADDSQVTDSREQLHLCKGIISGTVITPV